MGGHGIAQLAQWGSLQMSTGDDTDVFLRAAVDAHLGAA